MTTVSSPTTIPTTARPVAPLGALVTVVASAATAYGAHTWSEVLITVPVIVVVAGLVFGRVLPRALRKESQGRAALGMAIPGALILLPAFWSGLPLVLGVGAVIAGNAGRHGRSGAGLSIAGLVLGALTVLGYLATYTMEIVTGVGGFQYL